MLLRIGLSTISGWLPTGLYPLPVVALHCGSMSTNNVRCPLIAKAAARLIEVVVFPTPPFWLATQIVRLTLPSLVAKVSREKDFIGPKEYVSRGWMKSYPVFQPAQMPSWESRIQRQQSS
jgi:hypothetical protein